MSMRDITGAHGVEMAAVDLLGSAQLAGSDKHCNSLRADEKEKRAES